LYSTCRRNSPNDASAMCRASRRFLTIPAMCRSSMTTVPNSAARRVVSLCSPSFRCSATRPCALPRAALARRHRFDGSRSARRLAPPLSPAGVAPVLQRPRQLVKPGIERLLGALAPPRGDLVLGGVPVPPQRVQRPRQRGRQIVPGDAVGLLRFPLAEVRLHPGQTPVERRPRRPGMGPQRARLRRGGVQREPIGDDRHPGHSTAELSPHSPSRKWQSVALIEQLECGTAKP